MPKELESDGTSKTETARTAKGGLFMLKPTANAEPGKRVCGTRDRAGREGALGLDIRFEFAPATE